jgi:hypothetical protein
MTRAEKLFFAGPLNGVRGRFSRNVKITPEIAEHILNAQPAQRPVNRVNLDRLKQDMLAGKFVRTHQGVAFDENGLLSDGQHRLLACRETGVTIEVEAFFNEPRSLFSAYDKGTNRTLGTNLILSGLVDTKRIANSMASSLMFLWHYDSNRNPTFQHRQNFDFEVASKVTARHPIVPVMVERVKNNRRVPFPIGFTSALFTLMYEADADKAEQFIHQCLSGELISKGDPAYTVRESILGVSQSQIERAYKIARAWNAFYEGRRLMFVYGSTVGRKDTVVRTRDPFPEINGYNRPRADYYERV